MSFIETAYAMGPQAGGGGGEVNMFTSLVPFALIFLVFYFLLIRPQQKKAKEHKQMLAGLRKGDAVITAGGMYGRIVEVDGDLMVVDLGETKVTMNRSYLSAAPQSRQVAPPVKREKKGKKEKAPAKAAGQEETGPESLAEVSADLAAESDVTASPAKGETPAVISGGPADEKAVEAPEDKDKPVV